MASKSLTLELFGVDKTASKAIAGVGTSGINMGQAVSRGAFVAGAALGAAAVAAVAFSVESIKAFGEAEQAQNRLAFVMEKFPKLAGTNVVELQKLNTALQSKTRFEDDAIAAAQSSLALYDLTGDQLKDLTPLVLDFAAATGKDAGTAAEDIGKALMGQGRSLKEVGIDFQDTGDQAANYAQIVEGLTEKVAGFAERDAETIAGRLDQINNQFGDIQEKLGAAFAPALGVASDIITNTLLPQVDQIIERVGPGIEEAMSELGPRVEDAVNEAMPHLERLLEASPDILGSIFDSLAGDMETIEDGQRIFEEVDGFFNEYLPRWAEGTVSVQESWDGFFNWWDYAWDGSADTVTNKSNEIKAYWSGTVFNMRQSVIDAGTATLGWQFAQGFADGITSNSEAAILAAERMALAARDKVRNTMQIQSPSKVMHELGAFTAQGFALGIEDNMGMVGAAFDTLTDFATEGSSSRMGSAPRALTANRVASSSRAVQEVHERIVVELPGVGPIAEALRVYTRSLA